MKTTVLLNAAEDLPARAFCIANVRDNTVVRWLGVAEGAVVNTALELTQLPCIVVHAAKYGENCTACVIEPGTEIPMFCAVSLKPARPVEAESDGQLDE